MAFLMSSRPKKGEEHGITAVAIDKDRNSHHAVKWAVENLMKSKNPVCILVHVHCKILQPQDDAAPKEKDLQHIFVPYRGFCARKGVEVREVILYDTDITHALTDYIINNSIDNIVLGASSKNVLTRTFRSADVPSSILKSAPEFCAVYIISKGKIQSFRSPSQPQMPSSIATTPRKPQTPASTAASPRQPQIPTSNAASPRKYQTQASTAASPRHPQTLISNAATPRKIQMPTSNVATPMLSRMPASNATTPWQQNHHKLYLPLDSLKFADMSSPRSSKSDSYDRVSFDRGSDSLQMTLHDESESNYKNLSQGNSMGRHSLEMLNRDSISGASEYSGPPSSQYTDMSCENLEHSIASGSSRSSFSLQNPHEMDAEIRRLKHELKKSMELYDSVCKEAVLAKQMVREFHQLQTLEARKLEEARLAEEAALSLVEIEKQKAKAAIEAAQMAQKLAEIESQMRKNAEIRAKYEEEEKQKAIEELAKYSFRSRKYTIDEIEVATDYFASSNKIGEGGYGPVYKGVLDHTAVAIKILRPDLSQGQKQFQQEVEVLSTMRHPHMVILLGSCPEYGCLVYEYMERGSLEDRLLGKDNTTPIPWRIRFRIAAEIATGLLFLHEAKPEPLVHRDLKPANILLDGNFVSKISDVGLARLIPPSVAENVTRYRMTEAAGTFCYIDPEYQQSGMLSVKSDLYSLGVMLLQLITAKPPMGLSHKVEEAIATGTFSDMLDPALTDWPVEEALTLAKLALKCCELRKKDRPDLGLVVLPELNQLRDLALSDNTHEPETAAPPPCPSNTVLEVQNHKNQAGMRNPNVEMENST